MFQVGDRVYWQGWIAYILAFRCSGSRVVIRLVIGQTKTVSVENISRYP